MRNPNRRAVNVLLILLTAFSALPASAVWRKERIWGKLAEKVEILRGLVYGARQHARERRERLTNPPLEIRVARAEIEVMKALEKCDEAAAKKRAKGFRGPIRSPRSHPAVRELELLPEEVRAERAMLVARWDATSKDDTDVRDAIATLLEHSFETYGSVSHGVVGTMYPRIPFCLERLGWEAEDEEE